MSPEIREIIDNDQLYLGSVRAVTERLPESATELDEWIAHAITNHDLGALHFLLGAAALSDRPITPTASNSSISSTAETSTAASKNSDTTHPHP